ncbi:dipeptidase [Lawsonibacter asaccharolyticus]|nr:dipeptidase [Lawsonibacter asaccharolyticus]
MSKLNGHEQRLSNEIRQIDLLVADRLHQAEIFELTDEESQTFVRELHELKSNAGAGRMSCRP